MPLSRFSSGHLNLSVGAEAVRRTRNSSFICPVFRRSMPARSMQPFGRRGADSKPALRAAVPPKADSLSPDIVAAILHGPREEAAVEQAKARKVVWSFRAAVLAGLVVGFFNAALHATSLLGGASDPLLGGMLDQIRLGDVKLPLAVTLVAAGLWSGARASALTLFFAQRG